MPRTDVKRVDAPSDEDDHHDCYELHDVQSFFAGFGDALGVLPPEINGDDDGKGCGDETCCAVGEMRFGQVEILEELVEEAAEILAGGDAADRACKDVIEHQSGNAEFGEPAAEGLFYGAIDTAANEHTAAFDVHRADGVRKNHDGENEPRGRFADVTFGFAAGIVGGGGKVVQNDSSCLPEGNEGEQRSGCDYDARNCVAAAAWSSRAVGSRAHEWVIRPAD